MANFYCNDTSNNVNNTKSVNFTVDTTAPVFDEEPANQTLSYNTALNYNLNASDSLVGLSSFAVNNTINFKINASGDLENATRLGAALYNINITINDSLDNSNSRVFWVNVTAIASSVNLTVNGTQGNISIDLGSKINLNCSTITGDSGAVLNLYNNNSLINSGSSPIGNITNFTAVDNMNITCIYVSSQNYTQSSDRWWVNVSSIVDAEYPIFSNYYDNNASLVGSGTALFNVTLLSTNGTVLLEINNTNYTATNLTASVYNVSVTDMLNGTFAYRWHSWGNGTNRNYNVSNERSYSVNESDSILPVVNLISPANNTASTSATQYFIANFTDNSLLKNATLWIWNSTNNVVNSSENRTISGTSNSTNITIVLPRNDTYKWNYYVCDNSNNCAWNSTNWSLSYDAVLPLINITYPINNTNYNINVSVINYTFVETNPSRCWYSNNSGVWNSSAVSAGTNFTGIIS